MKRLALVLLFLTTFGGGCAAAPGGPKIVSADAPHLEFRAMLVRTHKAMQLTAVLKNTGDEAVFVRTERSAFTMYLEVDGDRFAPIRPGLVLFHTIPLETYLKRRLLQRSSANRRPGYVHLQPGAQIYLDVPLPDVFMNSDDLTSAVLTSRTIQPGTSRGSLRLSYEAFGASFATAGFYFHQEPPDRTRRRKSVDLPVTVILA